VLSSENAPPKYTPTPVIYDAPPDGWDGWIRWQSQPKHRAVEIWRRGWAMPIIVEPRHMSADTHMVEVYWRRVF
jgi:hypothetical protein